MRKQSNTNLAMISTTFSLSKVKASTIIFPSNPLSTPILCVHNNIDILNYIPKGGYYPRLYLLLLPKAVSVGGWRGIFMVLRGHCPLALVLSKVNMTDRNNWAQIGYSLPWETRSCTVC